DEITSEGRTPQEELIKLTWEGAGERFSWQIPDKIRNTIEYELKFIAQENFASYFLTVYDAVRFARSKGILCQGRGSAANSAVCYCLGITSVDPTKVELLFERFISSARDEPPDIDVDFEHERREEVMQYVFEKYGRHRAGIVATVCEYRQKSAIRDVGKAMGLSPDTITRLARSIWVHSTEWFEEERIKEQGLDATDNHLKKVINLAGLLLGFPRHLSQHTGGFVITRGALSSLCPIMNASMKDRTCIEWNKDDIDRLGMLKVDLLSLGMLTCVQKSFSILEEHYQIKHDLASLPKEDSQTYDMICKADTVGVFQIESRAQMNMLPRLKPRCYYDLVIEVAIVRPGPIQGDMVHPYIRRRNGKEAVEYPSEALKEILSRTLGVPLFQEQAMKIAIVGAGFTPAEADELRRSMATFKFKGLVNTFQEKLINGMLANGYTREFAERCFRQLEGFGSYGFPESHAASFAHIVYASSWIKCHYPDVFCCALLNSQPMGFYAPAQIVRDAREHGVEVRPVDINHSYWNNTLEEISGQYYAVRLGFRQVKGLKFSEMELLTSSRTFFNDMAALVATGISKTTLETLSKADALRSIGLDRRQALWESKGIETVNYELFAAHPNQALTETEIVLPKMSQGEHVIQDYITSSLSLKSHPITFVRTKLKKLKIVASEKLRLLKDGNTIRVAGMVLIRQRPGGGNVLFITIEDEAGTVNLVVFKTIFEKYRKEILYAKLLMAEGKLQKEGEVIHVVADKFRDLTSFFDDMATGNGEQLPLLVSRADEVKHGQIGSHVNKVFPEARNFR
ncbi:MAG: error-prone DNA polymerase, partial [Micavibrio aeruginosavorus]